MIDNILGGLLAGAIVITLELVAVWTYTGSLPWNL